MSIGLDESAILEEVKSWSLHRRRKLAESIASPDVQSDAPVRTGSLRDLAGLLGDKPAPTDEEIDAILEEERWRKYGG